MLSKTAEYALRLVVALAEANDETVPCQLLAKRSRVPEDYAIQILCQLRRAQIVVGHRGRAGGYRVRKPADRLNLLEVVIAIQPIERITRCPLGYRNKNDELCPLHQCLDDAIATLQSGLAQTTVASLVDSRRQRGLCGQRAAQAMLAQIFVDSSGQNKGRSQGQTEATNSPSKRRPERSSNKRGSTTGA